MKDLTQFNYEGNIVRTVTDESGETMWVAKDVAEVLGYKNTVDAITRHCKGVVKRYPLQTPGGTQDLRVIREADLYRLIVSSHLEGAAKFEGWVFEEVLPSIRKNGGYNQSPSALALPDFTNPAAAARAWAEQFDAKQKALAEGAAARRQIELDQPKVDFAEKVSGIKDGIEVGLFAKVTFDKFGVGRNGFFAILRSAKVLIPDTTTPYQKYLDAGWFVIKESTYWNVKYEKDVPYTKTLITGKGQVAIFKLLSEHVGKAVANA